MKPHPPAQSAPQNSTTHVLALLSVLCVLCGTLAVLFYRQSNERQELIDRMRKQQAHRGEIGQTEGQADDDASTRGSEQVFNQVNLLAQKDAVISELRQRILALQGGRIPEAGLSPNALPKAVRSSRQHKTVERTAAAPSTNQVKPSPPPPVPVFRTLAAQQDFLQNLDVDSMTASEQENHAELLKQIEILNRLVAQIQNSAGREASDRLQSALLRQEKAVALLMQQERLALFCSVGRELGYNDDSSLVFARYIEQVDSMTTFEPSSTPDNPPPLPGQ